MKFSIIIPVYNVEKYIDKCIHSVLCQTNKDYEIILIDDGSTDNSGNIIDSYKNEKCISVYHKNNGGLSDARNYGIEKACGDYLLFIDSDDFLCSCNCLEKISCVIDNFHPDVIQYKKIYWYSEDNIKYDGELKEGIYFNVLNLLSDLNRESAVSVSSCDKAIKRELVFKNNLRYIKRLLSEDIMFTYHLFFYVDSMYLLNENIYAYRQMRCGSISTEKSKSSFDSMYYIIKYWINFKYNNEKCRELYFNMISYWYLILRTDYPVKYYSNEHKNEFHKLDKVLLEYNDNFKVKMAYKLSKKIGFNNTLYVLRIYQKLKNSGLIRIKK